MVNIHFAVHKSNLTSKATRILCLCGLHAVRKWPVAHQPKLIEGFEVSSRATGNSCTWMGSSWRFNACTFPACPPLCAVIRACLTAVALLMRTKSNQIRWLRVPLFYPLKKKKNWAAKLGCCTLSNLPHFPVTSWFSFIWCVVWSKSVNDPKAHSYCM